ncbi:type I methionyl aminopeptidase [Granulicoccus phenolivorans]|uniref:type I methionyl aminopeptidase n=1 Tax=Granulicoccus phenolivorans TaxID=266854 RepID=UPI0004073F2A|nr:type I methionyl aminopeptidase [Granulicoccus phenolivorans]
MSEIRPYPVSPIRDVPRSIPRPEYVGKRAPQRYTGSHVQTPETIERMRESGRIAAQALALVGAAVEPGITTDELDRIGHEFMVSEGAYPSTLGYRDYPKSICTSVNEVICHGIPDARPLEDGDLVKIDITAFKNGVHGDNCGTFFCGNVSEEARLLAERTQEAMNRGIRMAKAGRRVNVIGKVIESYGKRFHYGVVRDYTGHGVHSTFHSGLVIPHYDAPHINDEIQVGMTFTVEPMITLGGIEWEQWDDGWTVVTKDRSWVAQFENTLVVTNDGPEVLTRV